MTDECDRIPRSDAGAPEGRGSSLSATLEWGGGGPRTLAGDDRRVSRWVGGAGLLAENNEV